MHHSISMRPIERYTNRRTKAESQRIVATRLLYLVQYLVLCLSRLQRIYLRERFRFDARAERPSFSLDRPDRTLRLHGRRRIDVLFVYARTYSENESSLLARILT